MRDSTICVVKTKVTTQLICAFVFAWAIIRFSHDVAHLISYLVVKLGQVFSSLLHLIIHLRQPNLCHHHSCPLPITSKPWPQNYLPLGLLKSDRKNILGQNVAIIGLNTCYIQGFSSALYSRCPCLIFEGPGTNSHPSTP